MASPFVNGSGAASASGATTTLTIAQPSGVQTGDFLIAHVGYAAHAPTCDGWTKLGSTGGAYNCAILTKVAVAGEGPYVFDCGSGGFQEGAIAAYRGPTAPGSASTVIRSANAVVTESVTAAALGLYIASAFGATGAANDFTEAGGGLTKDYEFYNQGLTTSVGFLSKPISVIGDTGTDQFHSNSGAGVVLFSVALEGEAGAGGAGRSGGCIATLLS